MRRKQRLIGRDHMFAASNRAKDQFLCRLIAADQFGHYINVGILNNFEGIIRQDTGRKVHTAVAFKIAHGDFHHLYRHTHTIPNQFGIFGENAKRSTPHGSQTNESNIDFLFHLLALVVTFFGIARSIAQNYSNLLIAHSACERTCSSSCVRNLRSFGTKSRTPEFPATTIRFLSKPFTFARFIAVPRMDRRKSSSLISSSRSISGQNRPGLGLEGGIRGVRSFAVPRTHVLADIASEKMLTNAGPIRFRNFAAQLNGRV